MDQRNRENKKLWDLVDEINTDFSRDYNFKDEDVSDTKISLTKDSETEKDSTTKIILNEFLKYLCK
jgi:hypothetical protein